jgi:hypothetical protein
MNVTLTLEQLLSTFENYNLAIWPMQVLAYVLGIAALFFAIKRTGYSSRIVVGILSFLWLWTAVAFFLFYFGPVYTPAYAFGVLFIIQGIVFFANMLKPRVSFGFKGDVYSIVGILEDIGLITAGVLGTAMILYRDRKAPS